MKIHILGCYGNVIDDYRATSFLVNDSLLLDAGTVTEVLNDEQITGIKNILITHTHIDHVKGLFSLVDELIMIGNYHIDLISVQQIIDIISKNLFNNLIWPDFTVIPSVKDPVLNMKAIKLEETVQIDGITIRPILMTHTVYTVGYIIKENGRGFMFTGDTGPTKRFWEVAGEEKGIEFIIADVSFPNRHENLAKISGHMTPSMLVGYLDRYGLDRVPVYIMHMKPVFVEEILAELAQTKREQIKPLEQGATITI